MIRKYADPQIKDTYYKEHFDNYLATGAVYKDMENLIDSNSKGFELPAENVDSMDSLLMEESLFRRIGTVTKLLTRSGSIIADSTDCEPYWIPENGKFTDREADSDFDRFLLKSTCLVSSQRFPTPY